MGEGTGGPASGGEDACQDHGEKSCKKQGDHPATQRIMADAMGRIQPRQARDIGLHRMPGPQEIGEARARTADESPEDTKQKQARDAESGNEVHRRLPTAAGADEEEIAGDEKDEPLVARDAVMPGGRLHKARGYPIAGDQGIRKSKHKRQCEHLTF